MDSGQPEGFRNSRFEGAIRGRIIDPGHRCHQVNAFGPYTGHSPHYRHHSALHQVRQLELIWDFHDAGPAERAAHARGLLREWQEAGTDETADAYLQELMKGAEDAASGHE